MKKYRVTKEHPFYKEGLEFNEEDRVLSRAMLPDEVERGSMFEKVKYLIGIAPTWFEEIEELEEYKVCKHITLKEWKPEVLEALKKTKICPLCEPVELPTEECKCEKNSYPCANCLKDEPKENELDEMNSLELAKLVLNKIKEIEPHHSKNLEKLFFGEPKDEPKETSLRGGEIDKTLMREVVYDEVVGDFKTRFSIYTTLTIPKLHEYLENRLNKGKVNIISWEEIQLLTETPN